jgi:hypothetical protein
LLSHSSLNACFYWLDGNHKTQIKQYIHRTRTDGNTFILKRYYFSYAVDGVSGGLCCFLSNLCDLSRLKVGGTLLHCGADETNGGAGLLVVGSKSLPFFRRVGFSPPLRGYCARLWQQADGVQKPALRHSYTKFRRDGAAVAGIFGSDLPKYV